MKIFGLKIKVTSRHMGTFVWQPHPNYWHDLKAGTPLYADAQKVLEELNLCMHSATYGHYNHSDNFKRIQRALERARIEMLNPNKFPID